jgi:hypothetical protein
MPTKEQKRTVLVEKRARALALMLLTRRGDLLIEEVQDDIGLDYIVRFHTTGKEGLRELGITLRSAWASATKDQADQVLRPAIQEMRQYGPWLRPVCLFFFTMEDDGAWYTWIAEPSDSQEDKPTLRWCDKPSCRQLDKRTLREMIERVNLWYDAVFPSLIANGPGSGKAGRKQAKP